MMPTRLVSRSESADGFRDAFVSQGGAQAAVWGKFLDLAPAGASEFWVALEDGEPAGRIGAARMAAYLDTGSVGFFEARSPRAAAALLAAAEAWLREKGTRRAVGPMSLNTWFPYRFRVDDHELSFRWEPNNPKEYPGYFEAAGYSAIETYNTPAAEGLADYAEKTRATYERLLGEGYTFRPFDGANFLEREVPLLHELTLSGFRENFLYEPISLEHFRELYVPLAAKMDFSHSYFALTPEGKEGAFFFIFPDGEYLVLKTITVAPELRGKGISTALTHPAAKRAVEKGMTKFTTALIRDGNRSESYTRKGDGLWTHRYALYGKSF